MKRLWNILAVLGIANVIGVAGFVGWLKVSDRLDMDRLRQVRAMLTPTLAEEAAKAEEDRLAAEAQAKKEKEEARLAGPPERAAASIDRQKQSDDAVVQTVLRARQEIADLRRQLLEERAKLDSEWATLAADKKKWTTEREEAEKLLASKQFKQALTTLESQKPKDAQQLLKLMNSGQGLPSGGAGTAAPGSVRVVAYLAAMQDRTRGRVLAEWVKDDPTVAAELLEQLRRRGVGDGAPPAPVQ